MQNRHHSATADRARSGKLAGAGRGVCANGGRAHRVVGNVLRNLFAPGACVRSGVAHAAFVGRRHVQFSGCASAPVRCQRGAILLMVLGLIVLTAFAVERFLQSALRQMHAQASGTPALELRLAANSGLQVAVAALAEINELDSGLYGPVQGWGDPLGYAGQLVFHNGVSVSVQITDEGGRIGLNPPERNQVVLLLNQMNVSQWEHDALFDSLMDWIDDDDDARASGAEDDEYLRMGSARLPANEPLRSYEDFRYIKGWADLLFDTDGRPNANYALLTATTSLRQSGGMSLNLNSAPAGIRYLLAEQSGLDARALVEHVAGDDRTVGTADDVVIRNAGELGLAGITAPDGTGFAPGLLRVRVEASRGASRLVLSVLLQPASGGTGGQGSSGGAQSDGSGGGSGGGQGGTGTGGGGQTGGGSGGSQGGSGSGQGGGSGGSQGGGGSGQAGGGSGQGVASTSASASAVGTLGGFTVIEYAENMVIE